MYKNFNITEKEKEQILNMHKDHGYKKPLNEQSFEKMDKSKPKTGGRYYFNNGGSISIQGSSSHYCEPREDGAVYNQLELGFPTEDVKLPKSFLKYQEVPGEDPTKSVFGYVPVDVILRLEKMNGGFRSEQKLPHMMINTGMSDENGKPKKDFWSGYVDETLNEDVSRIKEMMGINKSNDMNSDEQPEELNIDPSVKSDAMKLADMIKNEDDSIMTHDSYDNKISLGVEDLTVISLTYTYGVDVTEYPSFTSGRNWMSNGDPGYPDEGSDGEADVYVTNLEIMDGDGNVIYDGGDFTDMELPYKYTEDIISSYFKDNPNSGY